MTDVIRLPTARGGGNPAAAGTLWPTSIAEGIRDVVEGCRRARQIGLIAGPSGIGKSTAALAAVEAAQEAGHDAFYAMLTRAADGLQPGLLRIARALGAAVDGHMGGNDLHDAIVRRWWRTGSLVVIDEAQFASDALLDALRGIWDELDRLGTAPAIVLVGTPDLAERVKGRGARRARAFEPLRGRIGAFVELDGLEAADFAAIARHLGVAGAQAAKLIELAGRGRGGLHNVRRLVAQARMAAGAADAPLGLAALKRAAELAGVGS